VELVRVAKFSGDYGGGRWEVLGVGDKLETCSKAELWG